MSARPARPATALAALVATALAGCAAPPAQPQPVQTRATVTPVVLSAEVVDGFLYASARIEGVAEDGGECRFTFWHEDGGASRLTSPGMADGDVTVCRDVSETLTTITFGEFELVVSYTSTTSIGYSEPVLVTVPPF